MLVSNIKDPWKRVDLKFLVLNFNNMILILLVFHQDVQRLKTEEVRSSIRTANYYAGLACYNVSLWSNLE